MRIGIFTESYQPLINGVSTSVRTLMGELERAGHSVFVFTSKFPDYTDDRTGVFRFPSVNSLVEPDYVLPIPISPRIMAEIPKLRLDIVHSHSPFMLGVMAQGVARRHNIPIISTNHTLYTEYTHYMPILPTRVTRAMAVSWMRRYYNECDYLTVPSLLTRNQLVDGCGITTPISIVPTGIPAPPYVLVSPAVTKQELGIPFDARILLYVGRLAPEKNLSVLLRAFQMLCLREHSSYLVIAGSGKSEQLLRREAQRLGIERRVVFTGFLPRTKLDPLYRAADVFLFPSKTETQGLAVGEALASGTPCVVVNEGGAPESIRDGVDGYLILDSASEMAERAIELLSDSKLYQTMSENARHRANGLTPEAVAQTMMRLYGQLIERFGNNLSSARPPKEFIVTSDGDAGKTPGYEAHRDI